MKPSDHDVGRTTDSAAPALRSVAHRAESEGQEILALLASVCLPPGAGAPDPGGPLWRFR
jgi:hypothetical protein